MREAFDLLHERKDRFDIVIRDANLPDVDGSNLLESLKTDLPVISESLWLLPCFELVVCCRLLRVFRCFDMFVRSDVGRWRNGEGSSR